jgi:hypothetical protein
MVGKEYFQLSFFLHYITFTPEQLSLVNVISLSTFVPKLSHYVSSFHCILNDCFIKKYVQLQTVNLSC